MLSTVSPRAERLSNGNGSGSGNCSGNDKNSEIMKKNGNKNNASRSFSLSTHYGTHANAETYDNAYFYAPGAYMEHLVSVLRDRMGLAQQQEQQRSRCILDIGGGTGTFAEALVKDETTNANVVVVEPFLDPGVLSSSYPNDDDGDDDNRNRKNSSGVTFVRASAEDFMIPPTEDCWRTTIVDRHHGGYDQILLKEVVHHFAEEDRVGIFRGMREGFRANRHGSPPNGNAGIVAPSLLIVTRPQTDIDYPLWDEARAVWSKNQPSVEVLEEDLRTAGYTNLERSIEAIECSISLSRWQAMVKSRCWSTFSGFSDEELEAACETIAREAAGVHDQSDDPILRFFDRLILVAAS